MPQVHSHYQSGTMKFLTVQAATIAVANAYVYMWYVLL